MDQAFRVSFFKQVMNSSGHPVDACQGVVEVQAMSRERAIERAKLLFAKQSDISDWSLHADYVTVEVRPPPEHVAAVARTRPARARGPRRKNVIVGEPYAR